MAVSVSVTVFVREMGMEIGEVVTAQIVLVGSLPPGSVMVNSSHNNSNNYYYSSSLLLHLRLHKDEVPAAMYRVRTIICHRRRRRRRRRRRIFKHSHHHHRDLLHKHLLVRTTTTAVGGAVTRPALHLLRRSGGMRGTSVEEEEEEALRGNCGRGTGSETGKEEAVPLHGTCEVRGRWRLGNIREERTVRRMVAGQGAGGEAGEIGWLARVRGPGGVVEVELKWN